MLVIHKNIKNTIRDHLYIIRFFMFMTFMLMTNVATYSLESRVPMQAIESLRITSFAYYLLGSTYTDIDLTKL